MFGPDYAVRRLLFRIASMRLLTHTVITNINSADMFRLFIIKLDAVAYTCLEAEPFGGNPSFAERPVRFGFYRTCPGFGRSLAQILGFIMYSTRGKTKLEYSSTGNSDTECFEIHILVNKTILWKRCCLVNHWPGSSYTCRLKLKKENYCHDQIHNVVTRF